MHSGPWVQTNASMSDMNDFVPINETQTFKRRKKNMPKVN